MKRPLPRTLVQWRSEIQRAIADASETAPLASLVGAEVAPANRFQLAPIMCLKFRGRKLEGREADRVIKVAMANYVAHSNPDGVDNDLAHRPQMAFALCYVASHLALELISEKKAAAILDDFEKLQEPE